MSIQVESLTHVYAGNIIALRDVSLDIKGGEIVAVMGENGAGKTTLVKHFNGLLKPTRGRVFVNGKDTAHAHVASLSRKVGMIFQNPDHQIFESTVFREIAFGIQHFKLYKLKVKERVEEVADRVGLGGVLDRPPFELSVGDRKRVALASILAWNPDIIILDEPTVGQDVLLTSSLRHLLGELHREGKTIVMVSHDVEFVANLRPRVVLMHHGGILDDGPAESILTDANLAKASSLVLPQITQILSGFDAKPHSVLDVEAAANIIRGGLPN